MRTENWCGHEIRFIEVNGEWYAILKDICDALRLRTDAIASRLDSDMLERVLVEASDSTTVEMGLNKHEPVQKITKDMLNKDISRKRGQWKTHWMLAVNELGIYDMSGNVWELCSDKYSFQYGGPYSGHVVRGGSWYNTATRCGCNSRSSDRTGRTKSRIIGFRLALYPKK